ncbi:MAG: hypothetical protein HKL85_11295 [Acidimicrobiaceae bacterium]|nr:hypothetical protein [Acidimicrobiaceae bacterium]
MRLHSDGALLRHPCSIAAPHERFANLSEKIFAMILTLYGVEWIYEPLEFPLAWNEKGSPTRGFRPDFYLPASGTFIELTILEQRLVTKKNRKVREFRLLYPELPIEVVYRGDFIALAERHGVALNSYATQAA